jgi:uncharacterized membrane protein
VRGTGIAHLSLVAMKIILKAIEVDSPVHQVYSQWTRFEDFPHFMQGVKKVILLDDQQSSLALQRNGSQPSQI